MSDERKKFFLDLALKNWHYGKVFYQPCKKRGYFNLNGRYNEHLKEIESMLKTITNSLNILESDYLPARHFIGINLPTAYVTPHVDIKQFIPSDSKYDDWVEIRYNTFLQRPESGGVPIIDKTLVEIKKNEAIAFRADIPHSTTPVEGNTIRVVFSIGSIVSPNKIDFLNCNVWRQRD